MQCRELREADHTTAGDQLATLCSAGHHDSDHLEYLEYVINSSIIIKRMVFLTTTIEYLANSMSWYKAAEHSEAGLMSTWFAYLPSIITNIFTLHCCSNNDEHTNTPYNVDTLAHFV